jgi:C4-dicarboxylate-specific signal transduction histidine kinase
MWSIRSWRANSDMNTKVWKSRLAWRLVRTFSVLVALLVIVTVVILDRVGSHQIIASANEMGRINTAAVNDAGSEFQTLVSESNHNTSVQESNTAIGALQSMSRGMERLQFDTVSSAGRNFSSITDTSLSGALDQSSRTNHAALSQLSARISEIAGRAQSEAQAKAIGHVETSMLAMIDSAMDEQARHVASDIDNYVDMYEGHLSLASQLPDLAGQDIENQQATLDALVRRYPMFKLLAVVDKSGNATCASASDELIAGRDLRNYSGEPFFTAAMLDKPYVGLAERNNAATTPDLWLAVPIEIYRGRVAGVLMARLSLSDLADEIESVRVSKHGFAYVTGSDGVALIGRAVSGRSLLTRSATSQDLGWRAVVGAPRDEVMAPALSLESEIARSSQQTVTRMRNAIDSSSRTTSEKQQRDAALLLDATTKRIENQSRAVTVVLRAETARQTAAELASMRSALRAQAKQMEARTLARMKSAATATTAGLARRVPPLIRLETTRTHESFTLFAIILTVIACLAGALVCLTIAARIVTPIVLLVQGAHAIGNGELDKRVDEHAPDEIGDLAAAFNAMSASLKKSRSELTEAESQLVQSAKLASLGTLSAGVAHELNQPVAIIRGLAQQLVHETGLSEEAVSDLKMIEGQTSRMTKIIKHLRTFCRTGSSERSAICINSVINDCFILIGAQLAAHDIAVKLELDESLPDIMADANEIEQVMLNLITNARDALEGRPDACITIETSLSDSRVTVRFRDNGPGLPEEIIARIFDPFFTTKEAGKGTGLGLSISHGIVEKHGGTIEASNDPAGGAVFTLRLPARVSESGPADSQLLKAA